MSVSRAIAAGRLVKSVVRCDEGVARICDFALADQEWEANTDAQKRVNAAGNNPSAWAGGAEAAAQPGADSREAGNVFTSTERLKAAQADLAELKRDEARGVLVPALEVRSEWADILSQTRTRLLAIPTRVRQAAPDISVADVEVIKMLLREALDDLVRESENITGATPGDGGAT